MVPKRILSDYVHVKYDADELKERNHFGVEVEIENVGYNNLSSTPKSVLKGNFTASSNIQTFKIGLSSWSIVADHSLRDGAEFIFKRPLNLEGSVGALRKLQSLLFNYRNHNGSAINASDRCSVHVHMDVSTLTHKQIINLIMNYCLLERFFYSCVDPSRIKNSYCRPMIGLSDNSLIRLLLKTTDLQGLIDVIREYSIDKYYGLNVLAIPLKGTLEFRHHHGTIDMDNIIKWVKLLNDFRTNLTISYKDTINFIEKQGITQLIREFLPSFKIDRSFDEYFAEYLECDLKIIKSLDKPRNNGKSYYTISDSMKSQYIVDVSKPKIIVDKV